MITDNRLNRFKQVIAQRTKYITVVLEDLFQSHNASAVVRTCECLGIQDVHVIENEFKFAPNHDVALGSSKWINIYRYNNQANNTLQAIETLKNNNYRIIATSPHGEDNLLENINIDNGKIALLFGAELTGLSDIAINAADEFVKIPIHGFTESYNISVSAAICLYDLVTKLKKTDINWNLTIEEQEIILLEWLKKSVKESDRIINKIDKNI